MIIFANISNILRALIVVISTFIVIMLVMYSTKKAKVKNVPYLFRAPVITYVGGLILIMCLSVWIYSFVTYGVDELLKMLILSILPLFLGLFSFLIGLNWRIEIYEKSFVFRNLFRKKRNFLYSEIEKVIPISIGGFQIKVDRIKITIDPFVMNSYLLESKMKNEIRSKKE